MGSLERLRAVADVIEKTARAGNQLVVVLSAMSGETDRLCQMAQGVSHNPNERELDMLLSSGERVTIALMAMTLQERGIPAQSFTGRQVGIVTNSSHTKARITRVSADRVRATLADGSFPSWPAFKGLMSPQM